MCAPGTRGLQWRSATKRLHCSMGVCSVGVQCNVNPQCGQIQRQSNQRTQVNQNENVLKPTSATSPLYVRLSALYLLASRIDVLRLTFETSNVSCYCLNGYYVAISKLVCGSSTRLHRPICFAPGLTTKPGLARPGLLQGQCTNKCDKGPENKISASPTILS